MESGGGLNELQVGDLFWNMKEEYLDLRVGDLLYVISVPLSNSQPPDHVWGKMLLRQGMYNRTGYCLFQKNVAKVNLVTDPK